MKVYNGGKSVEKDFREALDLAKLDGIISSYEDTTSSCNNADFIIFMNPAMLIGFDKLSDKDKKIIEYHVSRSIVVDVKFRGWYEMQNWPQFANLNIYNYKDAFITDDLAMRRLDHLGGFLSFVIVGTDLGEIYSMHSAVLNSTDRVVFVNRKTSNSILKGKRLFPIDIGNKIESMNKFITGIQKAFVRSAGANGLLNSIDPRLEIPNIVQFAGEFRTDQHRHDDLGDEE
jgi:hypothetical protein